VPAREVLQIKFAEPAPRASVRGKAAKLDQAGLLRVQRASSDPTASSSPNKPGRPGAEAEEPRTGAEGKAGQHDTHRALNRERVTQALDCVREAARQRKKERFTALYHHISIELLRDAFFALKREGPPAWTG